KNGVLPERITHNDTKLNNVLLDVETGEAVCIIDLDTSMPGLVAYDFGDLVRTSTCFSAEDEKDLSKVVFQKSMFEALVRGYLSTAASFLTEEEVKSLVFGGILMTYEVGLRFLTDYLEGSVYFKSKYPEHNLIRSRTQMTLAQAVMKKRDELEKLTMSVYREILQSRE
ncbi:MAG: aminoglycoside phosphotransferase family protein, partial [Spirochaetales bacterium]|nr:aminoglycoside phosphotransferase family protein [Spirochaetales bacterium]